MTEYTVGCIADLISHGKIKTKKGKNSIFTSNEEQCEVNVIKPSKKFKLGKDETEQTSKQDSKSKKFKKEKHTIKDSIEPVKKNKVDVNTQLVNSKTNTNEVGNFNEVVHKKKKKNKNKIKFEHNKTCSSNANDGSTATVANKHKIKNSFDSVKKNKIDEHTQLVKPKTIINEIGNFSEVFHKKNKKNKNKIKFDSDKKNNAVDESTSTVDNSIISNIENKPKKKKKKQKTNFNTPLKIDNSESNITNGEKQSSMKSVPEIKTNSKKRKFSLDESQNESVLKPKKQKNIFLDLDHIPTDSEEENEKEKVEKPTVNKGINRHKEFVENTLFIGNIPITYDKSKVFKIFSKYGEIQSVRIRCVPVANINTTKKVAAVKKDYNPMRNSLVAYVKYKSQEGVSAALEANGMLIDGHHIRVDVAEENKQRDTNKAVFVGGLPFDIEDDELWEFFEKCGKIISVRVIRDSQTSIGKGFGYVNFDSTAAVELALKLDGELLKKRAINVKRCTKSRNKNKMNAFGKIKSKQLANELLAKRGKKFKSEKKKEKLHPNLMTGDFQGKQANIKEKKKKKLSKSELRKRKMVKVLGFSEK